jgi:hypothetical protein
MSSGLKASPKPPQNLLQTPPDSLSKREFTVLLQNNSGFKSEQRQEPTSSRKVPVQPFVDVPPTAQSQTFNFITMRRFQIDSTITRVRICKWVLLLTIKILSILTATVFWLAAPIFLKTLFSWEAPIKIFYELILRCISGSRSTTPIWRHIFPGTDYRNSYHLRLTIQPSSYLHSPIIYSASTPLLLDNPMVWLFVMAFMFTNHHLLCFAHDCLSKVSPTIRKAN